MNRQIVVMYAAGALAIIVLLSLWLAWQRGIVGMQNGALHVSLGALYNPEPSLDRPINFPDTFDDATKSIFDQNVAKAKDALRKSSNDVAAWFDLAIYYRMVNDQAGAVEIWKYVSARYPTEGISLHNLGEYYFHTAKEYSTAEQYYLKSIAVAPRLAQDYLDLFDMYRYVYKQDTSAAVDILKQAIDKVPAGQGVSFLMQIGQYYQEKGDKENARTYYKQALAGAEKLHTTDQIQQIQILISSLRDR